MPLGENDLKIVKFVQELLQDLPAGESVTPDAIAERIETVLRMQPRWAIDLDRVAVTDELIRRASVLIGLDTTLSSDAGHVDWLSTSRKKDWRYWQRYREWSEKRLPWAAIEGLDRSSDLVLGLLEDPLRPGPWDRRGLVVGHVQSGKTGNYTGLICKAADAGYKIIIVLAGLHNNLRSQTQMRLDEGFLGYETSPSGDVGSLRVIGVGEVDRDSRIRPNYVTNRSENGDFNAAIARKLGISPEQRPWLFVVKKNKSVLTRLLQWVQDHVCDHDDGHGRRVATRLPLLVIDDEADHASVDTGERVVDQDGKADEEHQPTAINGLIRRVLRSFNRAAYVGYTATPFANIFIHERGETHREGLDLFPAAFIINLAAPSNYIGPSRVFGASGLPLVIPLDNGHEQWMPPKHKKDHLPMFGGEDALPPSLAEAVDAFVLVCAARRLRGQGNEHSSMLVHVSRFSSPVGDDRAPSVQQRVHDQIEVHLLQMKQRLVRRIDDQAVLIGLQALWEREFVAKHATIAAGSPAECGPLHAWTEVATVLADAVSDIRLRRINGSAKDALDYVENKATGLKVIAIGGDKLSRGLTLEGLTVSYFLRASNMYDTLMQMGRWFGYRPGYLDLCRLYTTDELTTWFSHIAEAAEELREEFDLMAATGATPREYGLKVQSHPVLLVTSRVKMRAANDLLLSFSGSLLETVAFRRDDAAIRANLETARRLIGKLGKPAPLQRPRPGRTESWTGHLWESAPGDAVATFFSEWKSHPDAYKLQGPLIAEFITKMMDNGELTSWTVAVVGADGNYEDGTSRRIARLGPGVPMIVRSRASGDDGRYSIGRLLSPRDEALDLDAEEWAAALELTRRTWRANASPRKAAAEPEVPNGPAIRRIRGFGTEAVAPHPERGLLILYALDPLQAKASRAFESDTEIVAFGVSFPGSSSGTKVVYTVNNVLWEQEYGGSE